MPTPTSIGRYEILNRIGHGGMGALFLGRDPNINRLVAIKLLLHADLQRPEDRERFAREARAGGALSHPNIVTVFDFGEFDGAPFLVMEYIRGETVRELIRRHAACSLTQKLSFLEQLCGGLAFAHDAGVIHRDIKPANLMIDQLNLLKILDFGIARMADSGLTVGSGPIGTPGYMSPEQIQGRPLDKRADLFAVGAVAYELLTYRDAFPGETQHTIMHRVLHEHPPSLQSVVPEASDALAEIINRALQKDPANRYQDAAAMQQDFRHLREALVPARHTPPVVAPPPGPRPATQPDPSSGPDAADTDRVEVDQMLQRAQADLAGHKLTDADGWISRALQLQPRSIAALKLRSQVESLRLEMEGRATGRGSVKAACDRAWRFLEAGAIDAARRATDEAVALDPQDAEVLRLKASVDAVGEATVTSLHHDIKLERGSGPHSPAPGTPGTPNRPMPTPYFATPTQVTSLAPTTGSERSDAAAPAAAPAPLPLMTPSPATAVRPTAPLETGGTTGLTGALSEPVWRKPVFIAAAVVLFLGVAATMWFARSGTTKSSTDLAPSTVGESPAGVNPAAPVSSSAADSSGRGATPADTSGARPMLIPPAPVPASPSSQKLTAGSNAGQGSTPGAPATSTAAPPQQNATGTSTVAVPPPPDVIAPPPVTPPQTQAAQQAATVTDPVPPPVTVPPPAPTGTAATPPQPGEDRSAAPRVGRNLDLRGAWEGSYADSPQVLLTVERQDETSFSGTISVVTKAGKDPSLIEVQGKVNDLNVEIREVRIIRLGAVSNWNLGVSSGTIQATGARMSGTGRDDKTAYRWSFTRRKPAEAKPLNPAMSNLRGSWQGQYSGSEARLVIDKQDGTIFTGTLTVTTKPGKDPSEIQVEGKVSDLNIEIREVKVLKLGAAAKWNLGLSTGTAKADASQMGGTGRDGQNSYAWSFTRR
jgi:serine/threonine protein kinase